MRLVKRKNTSAIIIQKKFRFHLCKKFIKKIKREKKEKLAIEEKLHDFEQKMEGSFVFLKNRFESKGNDSDFHFLFFLSFACK